MLQFKETLSSLGHFWPQGKPDNRWPGRVFIDRFPTAQLHCLNAIPGDGNVPKGYQTICGITEDGQHVTMFEAYCAEGGFASTRTTYTHRINVTSNFMLVGDNHFEDRSSVKRISFSSSMVERVLRLQPEFFSDKPPITSTFGLRRARSHKQVVSYFDSVNKIRFRILRALRPSSGIEPTSRIMIDFFEPLRPKAALTFFFHFRQLMTVICGDLVDLWDVNLFHLANNYFVKSELYFAYEVEKPTMSTWFPVAPLIDIARDKNLFQVILRNWLTESTSIRTARGAFVSVVSDPGVLRPGHLRELVTIIEMRAGTQGAAPLRKDVSSLLRKKLVITLETFASTQRDGDMWIDIMRRRIGNINYHDARLILERFVKQLPHGFVGISDTFPADVIELRNSLTHDLSKVKVDDYTKLKFFVIKLKALFVLNDAIVLGVSPSDILKNSSFLSAAEYLGLSYV